MYHGLKTTSSYIREWTTDNQMLIAVQVLLYFTQLVSRVAHSPCETNLWKKQANKQQRKSEAKAKAKEKRVRKQARRKTNQQRK